MYKNIALLITPNVNEYECMIVCHESTPDSMIMRMYIAIMMVAYRMDWVLRSNSLTPIECHVMTYISNWMSCSGTLTWIGVTYYILK